MKNLLKTDFFRLFKAKITIISAIIAVALPFFTALLYFGLVQLMATDETVGEVMKEAGATFGGMMISSTFSFTNNFGLVLPVFASILIMSDVTSGTVRNKIIFGYSRHKIFLSHFIAIFAYCFAIMVVYSGASIGFGALFLGLPEATAKGYIYFFTLGLLGLAVVAAVSCALSLGLLNGAGAIILSMVICMGFGLIGIILAIPDNEVLTHLVRFIPNRVVSYGTNITDIDFWEAFAGIFIFAGAFYALGTFLFNARDLK